jgi:MFS family permease
MLREVLAIGWTQTIAWASSTYLIAIVAQPIARDLGLPPPTVFAAFSVALLVMAAAGPAVGRAIDRLGGRGVLVASNLVLAAGLVLLALATSRTGVFAAWIVLGIGMAMGLYDAAFAALVRAYGPRARSPITGVTLIAGFASTVGWPATAWLVAQYDWRTSCLVWAALHVFVALPANLLWIPRAATAPVEPAAGEGQRSGDVAEDMRAAHSRRRSLTTVALFFALAAFVTSAMAAHLPRLLTALGATMVAALAAAALVGPAQVAARLVEFLAAQRLKFHPIVTARIAAALHPLGAFMLIGAGGVPLAASFFTVLHGAGNGMMTIARGTLPLALFGASGYGRRQGWIGVPARGTQALAPYAFGLVLERYGASAALGLTAAVSLAALGALALLRRPRDY